MKMSYKIVTYLIIAISVIHVSLTPVIFDQLTIKVGWFIGVGLMGTFLGFLNIANWRLKHDLHVRRLYITANIAAIINGGMNLFVDKDPQGYLVVALFLYLTFASYIVSEGAINYERPAVIFHFLRKKHRTD